MLRIIKFLIVLIVIFIGIAVHVRNDQIISFDYYMGTIDLPFSLFLVISICFGAIAGILATMPVLIKIGHENSRLISQVRLNIKEIETLRIIPIKD
ncbi:MAG: uncharacterized membrane protein YciS (DUF1049 family) [Gammaproteobacteria bacterium]|jgi:uncharacterized membrane protein YciS (DUF1049 family)